MKNWRQIVKFNPVLLTGGIVNEIKQMLQIEHKPLRIPTDERLTSWLFTQRGRRVDLGATETKPG